MQEVRCQGEVLVASESWVLHQSLNIEELGQPALASIGRIFEVSGSGLCRALWIQVIRYPLLDMPTQKRVGAWSSPSPRWQLPSGTGLCRTNCCTCRSSLWLTWSTTLLRGRTVSFTREARVLRSFFEMPTSLSGRGHLVAGVTQWQDPPFTLRGRYEVVTRGCAKGRYEVITRVNTHVHYEVITSGHSDGPSHYEVITWSLQAHFAGLSLRGHYEPLRN